MENYKKSSDGDATDVLSYSISYFSRELNEINGAFLYSHIFGIY